MSIAPTFGREVTKDAVIKAVEEIEKDKVNLDVDTKYYVWIKTLKSMYHIAKEANG